MAREEDLCRLAKFSEETLTIQFSLFNWAGSFESRKQLTQDSKLTEVLIFLYENVFYCLFFAKFEILQTQNCGTNNINIKPHQKVAKMKSKFSLILG